MDGASKSKERWVCRERMSQQRNDPLEAGRTTPSPSGSLRGTINLVGSDAEFKKFEKLLGDSLERVQSLRKVGLTSRQPLSTNTDKQELGEYFLPSVRSKLPASDSKHPKSSMLSVAETQLTETSGLSESIKQQSSDQDTSYTVEYLLNENKHLKEEIEMILKSRGKLNETELLVRKISEYRRLISEQEAEISLLKKYNIVLSKEVERAKADMKQTNARLELMRSELAGSKQCSNKELRSSQPTNKFVSSPDPQQAVGDLLSTLRSTYQKSKAIQDLLSCLEKQIYWSSKEPCLNILHSPRRSKGEKN